MKVVEADKIIEKIVGNCPFEIDTKSYDSIWGIPIIEAIPIKWIVNWLTKQTIPATHTCDDYYAVEMMLDDWEAENGRSE